MIRNFYGAFWHTALSNNYRQRLGILQTRHSGKEDPLTANYIPLHQFSIYMLGKCMLTARTLRNEYRIYPICKCTRGRSTWFAYQHLSDTQSYLQNCIYRVGGGRHSIKLRAFSGSSLFALISFCGLTLLFFPPRNLEAPLRYCANFDTRLSSQLVIKINNNLRYADVARAAREDPPDFGLFWRVRGASHFGTKKIG